MELSAQQAQKKKKPTKKEALKKIPVIPIQECHCKKKDGSQELETPVCTVCQDNLTLGT
jgi:hypothetical protein